MDFLDTSWISRGFYMDFSCIIHGIFVDTSWIFPGFYMDFLQILHGFFMGPPWIFHGSTMGLPLLIILSPCNEQLPFLPATVPVFKVQLIRKETVPRMKSCVSCAFHGFCAYGFFWSKFFPGLQEFTAFTVVSHKKQSPMPSFTLRSFEIVLFTLFPKCRLRIS